jgi:hypothetical protein
MDISTIGIHIIDIPSSQSTLQSTSPWSTPQSTSFPTGSCAQSISPAR